MKKKIKYKKGYLFMFVLSLLGVGIWSLGLITYPSWIAVVGLVSILLCLIYWIYQLNKCRRENK